MCLILFGYKVSKHYPLILAANRDEFHNRPTAPMTFWNDIPSILAGRDLEQGGTWLGINKDKKFAALTNYRDPSSIKESAPSRGDLIVDWLTRQNSKHTFGSELIKKRKQYNGFNLLFGDINGLFWYSNLNRTYEKVEPGIHGLSNKFLDTPWPKVETGKAGLNQIIRTDLTAEALFSLLADQTPPDESILPDTGIGMEWEKILAPLFIQNKIYGTRSSTVILMDQNGTIQVTERTYDPKDRALFSDSHFSF